jgi:hypothetical protein
MEGKISLMKSYLYSFLSIPVFAVLYLWTALFVLLCLLSSVLHLKHLLKVVSDVGQEVVFI